MPDGYRPVDTGLGPEANRAVNFALAAADESPPVWWWLSFCDTERPAGEQFLGVAIVEAPNVPMATVRAWDLGVNPGGQVAAYDVPAGHLPAVEWRDRLLTRAEAEALQS